MKLHKWEDLAKARVGGQKLARLRARAKAETAIEMNLSELRKVLGKTQLAVADASKMAQARSASSSGATITS